MKRVLWLAVAALLLPLTVSTASGAPDDRRVLDRVAGATRIQTAVAIAHRAFPDGAKRVYLARADVLADAVAAGSLRDGPVLLVPSCDGVPSSVAAAIDRLDPRAIVALGGPAAVCDETLEVAAGSRAFGRLAGASRIETAAAIARESFPSRAQRVYLARADELADAVAAGSLTTGPVVLVPRCGSVPTAVAEEIARLSPTEVVALGGEAAICAPLLDAAARGRRAVRLAGPSRLTTAVAIAEHEFTDGATDVHLARADGLADAVAAGSLTTGPILLVPSCGDVPAPVEREIARLDPTTITALGGQSAVCDDVVDSVRDAAFCRTTEFANWGPATSGVSVTAAAMTSSGPWVVTRHRQPAIAAGLDPISGDIFEQTELPTGGGSWAAAATDEHLFVGTASAPDLYRIDPVTGATKRVARIDGERQFWDLTTSPDGHVFGGTFPGGQAVEYDPGTGRVRTWGQLVPGQEYVRSIAATERFVFAGIGPEAHLVRIDRVTGSQRRIAEDELAGEAFVYDVAVTDDTVVAGTWPSGFLVTAPLDRLNDVTVVRPETGARASISTLTIDDRTVFATARTGRLWAYDLDTGQLDELAVPVPDEETRALFVDAGVVTGVGGSGAIWTYDLGSRTTVVRGLAERGLEPGPEPPQSLAVRATSVYVGGHWRMDVFDLLTGKRHRHRAPGEPKALAADEDGVLAALYPDGELWRLDAEGTPTILALRVGASQIRPRDLELTRGTGRVVIATQSDYGRLGGAVAVVNGDGSDPVVLPDLIPWQGVRAVASDASSLYLGSEIWGGVGAEPLAREAVVGSYANLEQAPDWDLVPVPGATTIVGLEIIDDHPVGVTETGIVFAIDPEGPNVEWRSPLGTDVRGVTAGDGYLHVATPEGVLRVNPWTTVTATVLEGDATAVTSRPRGCGLVAVVDRDLVVGRA